MELESPVSGISGVDDIRECKLDVGGGCGVGKGGESSTGVWVWQGLGGEDDKTSSSSSSGSRSKRSGGGIPCGLPLACDLGVVRGMLSRMEPVGGET